MFPELEELVYSINQKSTYAMLKAYLSKDALASAHLTKLTNILKKSYKGKYGEDKARLIKATAMRSIGNDSHAVSFELTQTLSMIEVYTLEIKKINREIKSMMDEIPSPILSIPGISYSLGSIILAEIDDIYRFYTPSQLLVFAGLEPSTYQSGKFNGTEMKMVKRGSSYLRWALLEAARLIAIKDATFRAYYLKKKAEGNHHYVANSHVAKKLIRVLHHLLTTNTTFIPQG